MNAARPHSMRWPVFALLRVAAGPRLGHGHLRRAEALAAALGRPVCVSVRGAAPPTSLRRTRHRTAARALAGESPSLLILDDPNARHGRAWCRAAARRGVPVVSLHDLGVAPVPSALAIDGSITSPAQGWLAATVLRGVQYAVIRPPLPSAARSGVRRVLVSLGGGPRRRLAAAIVMALAARWPEVEFLVPHPVGPESPAASRVTRVQAPAGLGPWFASVDAAVVGGGLSLYEAVAAGVPTVALAVVPAQQPTVRAFAARRLTVDGGVAGRSAAQVARRVARRFDALMHDHAGVRRIRTQGPRLVDGRGAQRVADAIVTFAEHHARG